jgi:hypothetical protein
MQFINIKIIIGLIFLCGVAGAAFAFDPNLRIEDDARAPELPAVCNDLQVPAGNKMHFRVYAVGVQIYRWNGASWDFVAPVANLYADENFHGKVGFHYAGPTWESNSGSRVVGRRLAGCAPDASAIPWLLLETVSSEGPGVFKRTTFIQRVNTAGGLAPTTPGAFIGAEARVPYTTEYYFYRAGN